MLKTKQKILIIEDEKIFADLLAGRFEQEGYEAFREYDGESGLRAIIDKKPDLILLDIKLPIQDGYEVLRKKNEQVSLRDIPVIVITNSGQNDEIKQVLDLGVKDYIVKAELSLEEVLKKVAKQLSLVASNVSGFENQNQNTTVKVLLVEDDSFLSSIVFNRLQKEGFNIRLAKDGESALMELVKEVPDIVLLDLIMPGMTGFDVLEKIRADEKYNRVSVVIFSNLGQEHEIEKAKKSGADDFLIKAESTPSVVIKKINEILSKKA
jgi:DNA-binding response OmpR family regulator